MTLDASYNLLKDFEDIKRLVKHQHLRSLNVLGNAELIEAFDSPEAMLYEVILLLPALTTVSQANYNHNHFNIQPIKTRILNRERQNK